MSEIVSGQCFFCHDLLNGSICGRCEAEFALSVEFSGKFRGEENNHYAHIHDKGFWVRLNFETNPGAGHHPSKENTTDVFEVMSMNSGYYHHIAQIDGYPITPANFNDRTHKLKAFL